RRRGRKENVRSLGAVAGGPVGGRNAFAPSVRFVGRSRGNGPAGSPALRSVSSKDDPARLALHFRQVGQGIGNDPNEFADSNLRVNISHIFGTHPHTTVTRRVSNSQFLRG